VFLVTAWYGPLLLDGERVAGRQPFPAEPRAIAQRLLAIEHGEVLPEERALAQGSFRVAEQRLLALPGAQWSDEAPRPAPLDPERGFTAELHRAALLAFAKERVREASGPRDQHVVQAVQAIDDLAETANQLAERLREWYGMHFPESDRLVARHEEMATLVSSFGTRERILERSPHLQLPEPSMGAELGAPEQAQLQGFARALSTLYAQRAELDKYLDSAMPGIAPNVTQLVGAQIAARLLFHAGGLRELATLPSGTIQTLGAEKALFRHLKEGKRPPKHGVLFQHPLVYRAPWRERGRIARTLAGKVAIAARADAYTHNALAGNLQRSMEQRVEQVRRAPRPGKRASQRPAPPAGKAWTPRPGHARPGQGAPRGPQAGKRFDDRRRGR
jgi:nucleolar protein 56